MLSKRSQIHAVVSSDEAPIHFNHESERRVLIVAEGSKACSPSGLQDECDLGSYFPTDPTASQLRKDDVLEKLQCEKNVADVMEFFKFVSQLKGYTQQILMAS